MHAVVAVLVVGLAAVEAVKPGHRTSRPPAVHYSAVRRALRGGAGAAGGAWAPAGAPGGAPIAAPAPGPAPGFSRTLWAADSHKEEFTNEYHPFTHREFKEPSVHFDKRWMYEMKEGPGEFDLDADFVHDSHLRTMDKDWKGGYRVDRNGLGPNGEDMYGDGKGGGGTRTGGADSAALGLLQLAAVVVAGLTVA